jgi:hypothetical protein
MLPSRNLGARRGGGRRPFSLQTSRHAPENLNPNQQPIRPRPELPAETDAKSTIANADRLLRHVPIGEMHDAFKALLSLSRRLLQESAPSRPQADAETTGTERSRNNESKTLQRIENKIDTLLSCRQPAQRSPQNPWTTPTGIWPEIEAPPARGRDSRELTIQTTEPTDQAKRTNKEIVDAINALHRSDDAVAARRLPSGDWRVVFKSDEAALSRARTATEWIPKIFEGGEIRKKLWQVVASGFRLDDVRDDLAADLSRANENITICRVTVPKSAKDRKISSIYLGVETAAMANRLCEYGLLWNSSLYECAPFCEAASAKQCFKCYQFGHPQRYCRNQASCGWCSSRDHLEADCPHKKEEINPKCSNCKGDHPAWSQGCPKKQAAILNAKAAYQARPRRFPVPAQAQTQTINFTSSPNGEDSNLGPTQKKRRTNEQGPTRGRPVGSTKASQNTRKLDTWINLTSPSPPPHPIFTTSTATPSLEGTDPNRETSPKPPRPQDDPDPMDDITQIQTHE